MLKQRESLGLNILKLTAIGDCCFKCSAPAKMRHFSKNEWHVLPLCLECYESTGYFFDAWCDYVDMVGVTPPDSAYFEG